MIRRITTHLGLRKPASLCSIGLLWAPGCIVAEPVPYEAPPQTPPLLQNHLSIPQIGVPIPVDLESDILKDEKTSVDFRVPLRSEDSGDPLWYAFHLNYQIPNAETNLLLKSDIPPSTFEDTSREINRTWNVRQPLAQGCHQVTLVVAHASNWDLQTDRPKAFGDPNDVATLTWWINVDPPPGERFTLKNCPSGQLVER